jgi:hypothetical protein
MKLVILTRSEHPMADATHSSASRVPGKMGKLAPQFPVALKEMLAMAWDWWSTYGDEAWVILSEEFEQAGQVDGIDLATLQGDLAKA